MTATWHNAADLFDAETDTQKVFYVDAPRHSKRQRAKKAAERLKAEEENAKQESDMNVIAYQPRPLDDPGPQLIRSEIVRLLNVIGEKEQQILALQDQVREVVMDNLCHCIVPGCQVYLGPRLAQGYAICRTCGAAQKRAKLLARRQKVLVLETHP